jgi:sulfatase maturation enzyme AslB (radical SAM superfamily)
MIKNNTYTYIQLIHNYFTKFKTEHLSCYMGSNSMVVDVFGNVFPCFYRKDLFLGNINRNNTKDIFFNCLHKSNELINSNCLCEKCIPLFINYV